MDPESELNQLIQEFRDLGPAREAFELEPGKTVMEPEIFHRALEDSIQGLQRSLETYLKARRAVK